MESTLPEPGWDEPVLESERLRLRPLALDDARHLSALLDDDWGAVKQTGRVPFPPTEGAVREWIGGHLGGRTRPSW